LEKLGKIRGNPEISGKFSKKIGQKWTNIGQKRTCIITNRICIRLK
jgi:hypothetical protein